MVLEFIESRPELVNKSTVVFFFAVVVIVALIARYNSKSRIAEERNQPIVASPLVPAATAAPSPTATAFATTTPQPSGSPETSLAKVAEPIQPAVVAISVFEPSGKLLRN